MRIAARRGRAKTCVALTRKLAGILYAMWRDGTEFDPQAFRRGVAETARLTLKTLRAGVVVSGLNLSLSTVTVGTLVQVKPYIIISADLGNPRFIHAIDGIIHGGYSSTLNVL